MITHVLAMVLAAGVGTGQAMSPEAGKALEPAIGVTVERLNKEQERLRDAPQVERSGPDGDPSMLRATYIRVGAQHQLLASEPGPPPVVTVRLRAVEFEKRATNVNTNVEEDFANAPWRETPRGYVIDVRLRWTGSAWEQLGQPVRHPTLGIVGRP